MQEDNEDKTLIPQWERLTPATDKEKARDLVTTIAFFIGVFAVIGGWDNNNLGWFAIGFACLAFWLSQVKPWA